MSNAEVRGRFVWHELMTHDTAAAATFYSRVLPWRTAPSSMPGYTIWMAGQTQVGGLQAPPPESGGSPPHWLVYIGTPDVDATCRQAQGIGARVCKAPADIPNVGRFAVLMDPQGATLAVFTPGGGMPPPPAPATGGFSWHELATTDVAGALRFYGNLFGWRAGPTHDMGPAGVYQIFEHAGQQVGGMCRPQSVQNAPAWLSYVHVADAGRAGSAAKGAGGRLVRGPMEVPGGSRIAHLTDSQGGEFAVHELPRAVKAGPPESPAAKPPAPAATARSARPAGSARRAKKKVARRAKKKVARRGARPAGRKPARKPARKTSKPARGKRARTGAKRRARAR